MADIKISEFLGKTFTDITVNSDRDEINFITADAQYKMYHSQDCCEVVSIEDIIGDLSDLIGTPILKAEEASFSDREGGELEPTGFIPKEVATQMMLRKLRNEESYEDSSTWTFYKLATIRGYVDIRWFGSSNGYYSERVDLIQWDPNNPRDYY